MVQNQSQKLFYIIYFYSLLMTSSMFYILVCLLFGLVRLQQSYYQSQIQEAKTKQPESTYFNDYSSREFIPIKTREQIQVQPQPQPQQSSYPSQIKSTKTIQPQFTDRNDYQSAEFIPSRPKPKLREQNLFQSQPTQIKAIKTIQASSPKSNDDPSREFIPLRPKQIRREENNQVTSLKQFLNNQTEKQRQFEHLNVSKQEWYDYQAQYNKRYINQKEESYRLQIYASRKAEAIIHNSDKTNLYSKGINQFSDIADEEYRKYILGTRPQMIPVITNNNFYDDSIQYQFQWQGGRTTNMKKDFGNSQGAKGGGSGDITMTSPIDWRQRNIFHNVIKNQGYCGSCYIFATIAGIQTHVKIKKNKNVILSEQQLVDCCQISNRYGCFGCTQGTIRSGFEYSKDYGNIYYNDYPYYSTNGLTGFCRQNLYSRKDYLNKQMPYSVQYSLQSSRIRQLLQRFPLVALVDASNWASYKKGVFHDCSNYPKLNHGILIAGFTYQNHWIIKNSFGLSWGDKGFMILDQTSNCGITSVIVVPRLKPKQ